MTTTGDPTFDDIVERCREAVLASTLSQREIAERIGIDPTALSKALRGARRLQDHEIAALARACRVPQRFLLTGAGRVPAAVARTREQRPRQRADAIDSEVRRAQIREATARLIARRGYHNVRVADIARECGTSTGTVHYHFPSKADALREALGFYADRFHDRIEAELAGASDAREQLRRLIEVQLPLSTADVDEWSVWIQSWNEALLQPRLRDGQRGVYARWRSTVLALVQTAQQEGWGRDADADALTSRFTSMVDGLALQLLAGTSDMTAARMRDLLTDVFEPHIPLRFSGA